MRVQAAVATPTRVWTRHDALDTRRASPATTPRTQPRPSRDHQAVYDYSSDDDSSDQDDGEDEAVVVVVRGPPRLRRALATAGATRRALEF